MKKYSASVTNIGSQMVASRCGYIPFWVDTFETVLDESFAYHNMGLRSFALHGILTSEKVENR